MTKNVLEYLENSAARFPDKKAFEDETSSCTYGELSQRAKIIGSVLAHQVPAGLPIPVFMEKSATAVSLFMGIVSAGCFYVMLDVKQPVTRLNQILKTLGAAVIITDQANKNVLACLDFAGEVLTFEDIMQNQPEEKMLTARRNQALDIDPLYGIFTSGSTGVPKCVVINHRSVIDFMDYFTDLFHIEERDIIGNQAPFDFDVSVKDIYSTLKTGATMAIIPRRIFSVPTQLIDYLSDRKVTTLIWAVSALCLITTLNAFEYKIPQDINKILFSGEVMPIKHLNKWREIYPEALFVNLYGPTEITCNCTYYIVDRNFQPGEILPMGKAFPNEKIFLLDENNRLITEQKQPGELCVSGTALALGYYNNQEQTEQAFVQNPLNPHFLELIYRTGDLAYYNDRGELCFATRKDFQIKHMGQRIELGEIEICMDRIPEIRRACCIFDAETNKIIAFYEGDITKGLIIRQLKIDLPVYMLPNTLCRVEAMPISKNGKIDRTGLQNLLKRS